MTQRLANGFFQTRRGSQLGAPRGVALLAAFALSGCSWYESHNSVKITTWIYERPEAGTDGGVADAGDAATDDQTDDAATPADAGSEPEPSVDAATSADASMGGSLDGSADADAAAVGGDDSGAIATPPGEPEAGTTMDASAIPDTADAAVDADATSPTD